MKLRTGVKWLLDKVFAAAELKTVNGIAAVLILVSVVMLISFGSLYQSKIREASAVPYGGLGVGASDAASATQTSVIMVHIKGAVAAPGVYSLPVGSRTEEAVSAAGGFAENADHDRVNLAQKLYDGAELVVPSKPDEPEPAKPASKSGGGKSSASVMTGRVSINTGTKEQLMTLKGIGEAYAMRIIRYREENGDFQRTEDLMKIKGITRSRYDQIKDNITL